MYGISHKIQVNLANAILHTARPSSSPHNHNSLMDSDASSSLSPYALLLRALSLVPLSHYLSLSLLLLLVLFYNLLEIHFLHDLFTAFRGDPVNLIFHSSSPLCQSLAATCHVLRGRYLSTPWLSGPHLQTAFLTFFGRAPNVTYKRQLFRTVDGGTIALDWLYSDVLEDSAHVNDTSLKGCKTPIVIVIPGLTSDSTADYIKHFAFKMARQGRNVVVSNHRGLAGVSLTSDCFYNAGWTEDIRKIVEHIHSQYPEAPLYAVGTSIGANILVKYLGEDGVNTPIVGAAAICSPWDLLICDRFINRKFVQKFYNRVLAVGLQGYAQLHQSILTRLANWDNIKKSHSVRDFDDHATRVLGKFETVDSYYRHSSSASYVRNVSVPLLCISALDDPVCTREAIPLDECRANENIMLATTQHGGHLAFYEGINASSLWWVRAVDEFLGVLHSSPFANRVKKVQESTVPAPSESLIDQGPYVNVVGDGMVTAAGTVAMNNVAEEAPNEPLAQLNEHDQDVSLETEKDDRVVGEILNENNFIPPSQQPFNVDKKIVPMRRQIDQLSRYTRISIWLLAWIAFSTTWPWLGSALTLFLKRRFKRFMPTMLLKR